MSKYTGRRITMPALLLILVVLLVPTAYYTGLKTASQEGEATVTQTTTVTVTYTQIETVTAGGTQQGQEEGEEIGFKLEKGLLEPLSWESVDQLLAEISPWGPTPLYKTVGPVTRTTIQAIPEAAKPGIEAPAAPSPGEAPGEYSRTNVRVEGVDEIDVVKVNGTHAFIVTGDTLYLVKAWPPEELSIVDKVGIGDLIEGIEKGIVMAYNVSGRLVPAAGIPSWPWIEGIYLHQDDVIVVVREGAQWGLDRVFVVKYRPGTGVKSTLWATGNLVDSRLLNDTLVLVLNQPATYPGARPLINGEPPSPEKLVVTGTPQAYVNVVAIDVRTMSYTYTGILGPGATTIYMTANGTLYIAQSTWQGPVILEPVVIPGTKLGVDQLADMVKPAPRAEPSTMITRINPLIGEVEAHTIVDGRVRDTWGMDEYKGYLRVVVDTVEWRKVRLYILDAATLSEVSRLDEIAVDEEVYGVRFMGDMVYLVTFRRVDPLFAISLADPKEPVVIGYLKAPGFDDYLHPLPGGLLLGIGYERVDRLNSVRITIYNITTGGAPEPLDRLYIKAQSIWSPLIEAPYGYRLLDINMEKGVIAVPIVAYNDTGKRGWETMRGYAVIEVNTSKPGLSLKGYLWTGPGESLVKAFHIGDTIYLASTTGEAIPIMPMPPGQQPEKTLIVRAYNMDTLQQIGEARSS
ncbi:MAG: beta-propeller domain-containing protein [Desulfurococcales archaeon]|nr:beta-propeller domain-containing protein [Desulfurococcales archaeon]